MTEEKAVATETAEVTTGKETPAAVEATETHEADPANEITLHSSITEILSHNSDASALGGNDEVVEKETTAKAEKPKEEADEAKKVEEGAETTAADAKLFTQADLDKHANGLIQAYLSEKGKRQALENPQNQKPVEKADLFENPDERLAQETEPIRTEFSNKFLMLAESQARGRHGAEKFGKAQDAFLGAAKLNPGLVSAAINAADPGEYQYVEGNKILLGEELGSGGLAEIQVKADAKATAGIEAEVTKRVEAKLEAISKLPPGSVDFNGKTQVAADEDLDESLTGILGR